MKPNLIAGNASLILGLMMFTLPGFPKTPLSRVSITIRLLDHVNLLAEGRQDLEANAKRVFGAAGVAVELIQCFRGGVATGIPACTTPLGPTDFVVRVLHPKLAAKDRQLGYAAMTSEGGAYVTVFLDPARRRARVSSLTDGTLLGHAVAHEIGHLLLGPNSHSSSGIMRPVWLLCDEEWMAKRVLLFGSDEAIRMRAALTARTESRFRNAD